MNSQSGAFRALHFKCLTLLGRTCNCCSPFAVVQDGQLPEHVARGQGAQVPSSLGDLELAT